MPDRWRSVAWRWTVWGLLGVVALAAAAIFLRESVARGSTLELYRAVAQASLQGEPPYAVAIGDRDLELYKYPPWTIPVFWPLAVLPLTAAKLTWALGSLAAFGLVFYWVIRRARTHWLWAALVAIALWHLWLSNGRWGQVNLPLLALLLWAWPDPVASSPRNLTPRVIALIWGLSFKIFFLPALLVRPDLWKRRAVLLGAPLVLLVLSLPVWLPSLSRGLDALPREFSAASSSGDTMYAAPVIRMWPNQGLPAVFLRVASAPPESVGWDLAAFAGCLAGAAIAFWFFARRLLPVEQWSLALATLAAVHPLAWSYNYVLAYPLAVLAIDRSWKSSRSAWPLAVVGVACLAVPIRPLFERLPDLALASPRALGVMLLASVLVGSSIRGRRSHEGPAVPDPSAG